MTSIKKYNEYGEELERRLRLRTSPLAVKMLEKEEDIPEGAVRPKRDRGYHLAQCQAFGISRREKDTIAMLKEDNWCPGPLMTYGLVEMQRPESGAAPPRTFDSFEYGKYIGIVTAPLITANYKPDLVLVYSNISQLRSILWGMRPEEQAAVETGLFTWSCYLSVVKPMLTGNYWLVLPDPGEYERALGTEDEMMFSIPEARLEVFMEDFQKSQEGNFGYMHLNPMVWPDFPQPEIYKNVFKQWGLDS